MNLPKAKNAVERLHRLLSDPEEGCQTWTLCLAVAFSDLEIALSQQRVVIETVHSKILCQSPIATYCGNCGNYLPGHATGGADICTCPPAP